MHSSCKALLRQRFKPIHILFWTPFYEAVKTKWVVWIAHSRQLAVAQVGAIDFTMAAINKNNTGWAVIACA
jgi:hypothetical protein